MKILHIDLRLSGSDRVELRYFWDNPNDITSYPRSLSQIEQQTGQADTDYYTQIPVDFRKTGKALYDWLDSSDRILDRELDKHRREGIILAISTGQRLAHLPWELLHDGRDFLVNQLPPIIPIRWVKTGREKQLNFVNNPVNRALNVLFMASSARGVEPELDFEGEEEKILKATRGKPLFLVVEESGYLAELCDFVKTKEREYFDVIHLMGHATIEDEKPYFITETEYGDRHNTSARDIAEGLLFNLPKLIFLSGCRTGYSKSDEILSMAEELLTLGATAVLGWGKRVRDGDASDSAAILYQELALGSTVLEALTKTYQSLFRNQARDWHCLRLFVAGTIPAALVTRGRKPLPPPSIVTEFIDPEKHLRVASRETFVGRRRELQSCLRVLKNPAKNQIGVFIQGMGGNGKSMIAARLCDRLPDHEKAVWWRQIDETELVDRLCDKLRNSGQRSALKAPNEELKYRLRDTLEGLEKPFLFIFDDFEWNLEYRGNCYLLKTEIAELLKVLVWAIKQTNYYHRVIITCRYEFESDLLRSFYPLPSLRSLQKADLQKKLRRLANFNNPSLDESYLQRALELADGNPRLLEWLDKDVLGTTNIDELLSQYENSSEGWRDKVIWELENEPKLETDAALDRVMSHCLIYNLPMPWSALEAVCASIPKYEEKLQQAKQRGLIEESADNREEKLYRASHLPRINPCIHLPEGGQELLALSRIALREVDTLWNKNDEFEVEIREFFEDEEICREIFRLSFMDTENPQRFREGFWKMLNAYYGDIDLDRALEKELRQQANHLSKEHLFDDLEGYLQRKEWNKADEETAWICYQLMVIDGHDNFYTLFRDMSLEYIDKIDALWSRHSKGKFGCKRQAKIYQDLGGTSEHNYKLWDQFGDHVGWRDGDDGDGLLHYSECQYGLPYFPILMYYGLFRNSGFQFSSWNHVGFRYLSRVIFLFSRINST